MVKTETDTANVLEAELPGILLTSHVNALRHPFSAPLAFISEIAYLLYEALLVGAWGFCAFVTYVAILIICRDIYKHYPVDEMCEYTHRTLFMTICFSMMACLFSVIIMNAEIMPKDISRTFSIITLFLAIVLVFVLPLYMAVLTWLDQYYLFALMAGVITHTFYIIK